MTQTYGKMKTIESNGKKLIQFRKEVRNAIANYMQSEGCSCCRDMDAHEENKKVLAKLLNVPKYSDGSGYNFIKFKNQASK